MAFTYDPLEGNNAFRLLRLLGGEGDVVECELFHANSDYSKLRYEAVSYCWGSKQRESAILIDGKTSIVRESLIELLKHLRHSNPQKHRTIWIDAVCIDQGNNSERGHQVQQMRRIYASARRVIFWLGELTPDVRLLMIALDAFNRAAKAVGWNLLRDEAAEQCVWYEAVIAMDKDRFILNAHGRMREGLRHLLKRPWFSRAWIIQEVANARRGIIQCGHMVIACRPFALAPKLLGMEANSHCRNVLDAMPTHLRNTSWWSDDRDLFGIIQKFRYSESTLDCDRIYALRGLCTFRDDKTFLGVDYKQSIQHVINDAISHIFMCDRHALPDSLYSSMGAFLNDLESMHLRVLIALLKSENIDGVRNILKRYSTSIKISPLMLNHAVSGIHHGQALTELLLEFCQGPIEISESIITTACENRLHGSAVIRLLLMYAQNIRPSPGIFIAAARNPMHAGPILSALIRHLQSGIDIATPELIYNIAVNQRARSELTEVMFQQLAFHIEITEDIAVAAAKNKDDLLSLDAFFQSGKLVVTERMLLAAAENLTMGPKVVQHLLQQSTAHHFKITDRLIAMMIDAVDDSLDTASSFVALRMLLDHRKEETIIGDQILISILTNREVVRILNMFQAKAQAQAHPHQGLLRMSRKDTDIPGPVEEAEAPRDWALLNVDPTGHQALCWAIQNSQGAFLEVLIRKGADTSVHGPYKAFSEYQEIPGISQYSHPLFLACEVGDYSIIELLLDNGADINQSPSALIAAVGRDQLFQFLLEHGAQINGELLISAVQSGNIPLIELAFPKSEQDAIYYSLNRAVYYGQLEIVRLLLKSGARVNPPTESCSPLVGVSTPLHNAVIQGDASMDMVEILLQSGARVNEKGWMGSTPYTPLRYAASRRNWKLYERLLEAGADESLIPGDERLRNESSTFGSLSQAI